MEELPTYFSTGHVDIIEEFMKLEWWEDEPASIQQIIPNVFYEMNCVIEQIDGGVGRRMDDRIWLSFRPVAFHESLVRIHICCMVISYDRSHLKSGFMYGCNN